MCVTVVSSWYLYHSISAQRKVFFIVRFKIETDMQWHDVAGIWFGFGFGFGFLSYNRPLTSESVMEKLTMLGDHMIFKGKG